MGILKRNKDKNRKSMGIGLADHGRSPRKADEQVSPEPERVTRPDEEADQAVYQLKNPPQAEGER
jgi:hypothetical protein